MFPGRRPPTLDGMTAQTWIRVTGVAILVVPVVDVLARLTTPGWILVFTFVYGAPFWLVSFGLLIWIGHGLLAADGRFARVPPVPRTTVLALLWAYLLCLTTFAFFASDGGDADYWQSPAGLLFGVDGYHSGTPALLKKLDEAAGPALLASFALLLAAALGYGIVVRRARISR